MSARTQRALFALAIFLSSGLLFFIEPLAGKRVLPLLGGSAAVWTACLVFFQCALLLGYLAAHWLNTRTSVSVQGRVYLALLGLSVVQLVAVMRAPLVADTSRPVSSVLLLLTEMIVVPFVTLSISSPLLQAWFARTAARSDGVGSANAYHLYAISNTGSLLALVSYPWLVEPRASLRTQSFILIGGLVLLGITCAAIVRSMRAVHDARADGAPPAGVDQHARISVRTMALWIGLSACGSLLLSAVTVHLTRNVAAIPLLWVVPLIAYLLSFVVAFGDDAWHPRYSTIALGVTGVAIIGYRLYHGDLTVPVARAVTIYCGALFGICLFCHSELYRRRPHPSRLTTFYFCLAAGGAIGATLAGVVAPAVLNGEYELVIGLGLVVMLGAAATWDLGWMPRIVAVAGVLAFAALLRRDVELDRLNAILIERNFYGTLQVTQETSVTYHAIRRRLLNGIIEHGQQVYRADMDTIPTTYYGRTSGAGLAVSLCCADEPRRIGVIGLGTGTMAAYGRSGDVIRFYDINPAVEPIARNYFTYLRKSKARVDVVTGDARLSLAAESPQNFDVLVVDAFSGDAIPVHLITTEALALYRRHLSPRGAVAFHVSNRYLDLAPVVKQLAEHAGMSAVLIASPDDTRRDVFSSDWVVVTSSAALADALRLSRDKEEIAVPAGLARWTDDYNSLLPILKTKRRDE